MYIQYIFNSCKGVKYDVHSAFVQIECDVQEVIEKMAKQAVLL